MFLAERWAEAYVGASGVKAGAFPAGGAAENAGEGLALFRAVLPLLREIPGEVSGSAAALRIEKMLRGAAAKAGEPPGAEAAIRLLALLVKKGNLRFGEDLAGAVEKLLDRRRGTLECVLEAAAPPEENFQAELEKALIKKTGATGVRILPRINPELLGGFRLRLGDEVLDASLRGQLEQMAADLNAVPPEPGKAGSGTGMR
jgi:F-type H+-transporting ATPase subunit delta